MTERHSIGGGGDFRISDSLPDSHPPSLARRLCCLLIFICVVPLAAQEDDPRPAKGIQDNSFFIEEAYNQEAGVVQHILNGWYSVDRMNGPDDKEMQFVFTQEWPIGSQTHQFSYTAPYSFLEPAGSKTTESRTRCLTIGFRCSLSRTKTGLRAPAQPHLTDWRRESEFWQRHSRISDQSSGEQNRKRPLDSPLQWRAQRSFRMSKATIL